MYDQPKKLLPQVIIQNHGLGNEVLSILIKISKDAIEVIKGVLLKFRDKAEAFETTLLNLLNISPSSDGLYIEQMYNSGSLFSTEILDIKREVPGRSCGNARQ